ncbi:MAG: hypothetical protein N2235_03075, partial [Fischerella sp.]|nr:hypothetical protein [Fischerella sp.]
MKTKQNLLAESKLILESYKDSIRFLRQKFKVDFRVRDLLRIEDSVGRDLALVLDREFTPHLVKVLNWALDKERLTESENPADVVIIDIPLMIRLLEYAREDARSDVDLHQVASNLIELSRSGKKLTIKDYDTIMSSLKKDVKEETRQESKKSVTEAGAFSYGHKPPRKGTSAYDNLEKRKEAEKNYGNFEPKDDMVGTARRIKDVKPVKESQELEFRNKHDGSWAQIRNAGPKWIAVTQNGTEEIFNDGLKAVKYLESIGYEMVTNKVEENNKKLTNKVSHPFAGGKKATTITRKHVPLVWENMLGTVYARDPLKGSDQEPEYFDYDWDAARKYARVDQCSDLRIYRTKVSYQGYPRAGKLALWGIPPAAATQPTQEGYEVVRGIDPERYAERPGLEGPFSTKSGKVVYYDPKEGMYYDPDSDMYIDYEDYSKMNEGYWQDAVAKAEKNHKEREGKPYEKNPASHDKQGVYKGDKDLSGKLVKKVKTVETVDIDNIHLESIREHLLSNSFLYEDRTDFKKVRKFLDLHKTDEPIIGKTYTYASVFLLPVINHINIAHFGQPRKLVDFDQNYAYFDIDGEVKRFPESGTLQGDALSQIYFFNDDHDFQRFNTTLTLTFSDYNQKSKILDQNNDVKKDKNPANHDEQGVYKGDKDLSGKPVKKESKDPCWKNYKQIGMKEKNGKKVPNCVPKESVEENWKKGLGAAALAGAVAAGTHMADKADKAGIRTIDGVVHFHGPAATPGKLPKDVKQVTIDGKPAIIWTSPGGPYGRAGVPMWKYVNESFNGPEFMRYTYKSINDDDYYVCLLYTS